MQFFHVVWIKVITLVSFLISWKEDEEKDVAKGNEHLSFMPWNFIKKCIAHIKCKFIDCKQKTTWIHWFVTFASYFVSLSFYYYYSMRKNHLSSSWGSICQKKAIPMPLYAFKNRGKITKIKFLFSFYSESYDISSVCIFSIQK